MHQTRGVPLVAVLLLAAAVVLAFAGSTVRAQSWAVEAGTVACPNMTYCASYPKCSLTAPNSYFKSPAGSPPYANAVPRQLAATPIRVAANNTFQVETVKVIFSLWPSDPFNFTLALFFFEANMTDESFPTPGAALEGWEGGRAVYFQKESDTPVSPVDVNAPYFRVSTTVARPFNLTAGTYFVSVATYGNTMQPATYPYRVAGSPTDGAYYPIYLGFNRSSSLYPGSTQSSDYATNTWVILNTTTNVVPCLWPTGTTFRPQGSNTTNTTTTTTGSNSTTTTTTTTTAGTTATTTGGSGGGNNPTDYLVRFSLTTELNNLSPAGFVSGVSDALELPSDAPITLVAARRAQVTTDESKRATETGTLVDFYISGSEGASLMDKALSAKLSTLRGHNVSIASAPTQIYPDASPGSLLRPSAFLLLLLQAAALLFLC